MGCWGGGSTSWDVKGRVAIGFKRCFGWIIFAHSTPNGVLFPQKLLGSSGSAMTAAVSASHSLAKHSPFGLAFQSKPAIGMDGGSHASTLDDQQHARLGDGPHAGIATARAPSSASCGCTRLRPADKARGRRPLTPSIKGRCAACFGHRHLVRATTGQETERCCRAISAAACALAAVAALVAGSDARKLRQGGCCWVKEARSRGEALKAWSIEAAGPIRPAADVATRPHVP